MNEDKHKGIVLTCGCRRCLNNDDGDCTKAFVMIASIPVGDGVEPMCVDYEEGCKCP